VEEIMTRISASRILPAAMTLSAAVLALSFAAPLSVQRTGSVFAATTLTPAPHADGGAAGMLRQEGIPLFFGFLEFDFESGRIPGFGPWPAEQAPHNGA
jgi:hypothetical protein